jgi:hypothetical protein
MNEYFYLEDGVTLVKIRAKKRPGPNTRPRSDTWVIYEIIDGRWSNSAIAEVTWGILRKLEYIGKRKVHR